MNGDKRKMALDIFVKKLKNQLGGKVVKIILFGSYARGEAGPESDIDLLVVGDVSLDDVMDISYPLLLEYGVYVSPKVMTINHYNFLDQGGYGFLKNVKREGRVLYA
jgi:predicted nucleotidyltransferase